MRGFACAAETRECPVCKERKVLCEGDAAKLAGRAGNQGKLENFTLVSMYIRTSDALIR